MLSDTLALIFFVGGMQGLMLTVALARLHSNHPAMRYLIILVGLVSLDLLGQLIYWQSLYREWPHLLGINSFLPTSYGPLFYLYVRTLLRPGSQFRAKDIGLFTAVFVCYGLNIDIYLMTGAEKIAFVDSIADGYFPITFVISNFLMLTSLGFVLAALYRLWKDRHAGIRTSWLDWVLIMGLFQVAIWVVVIINLLMPWQFLFNGAPYLLVSLMLYVLGYKALFAERSKPAQDLAQTPAGLSNEQTLQGSDNSDEDGNKYGAQRLDESTQHSLWQQLELVLVKDRLFTQPDLRVADLANRCGLSVHLVSQVINDSQGKNFNEMINHLRLTEACRLLREDPQMSVQSVMEASGFQAKSTFNTLFKQMTGHTPSAYRKQNQIA